MPIQLTQEQLKIIQEKIKPIFEHLERKKALELTRALEARIVNLEATNPALYKNYQKLIAQLKWVACPLIKDDREFLELVEKYFLEGLELDINLIDLATAKLELQFGVNLRESINDILSALRSNKQKLGASPMQIKGESSLADPLVKNWLIDFIRSAKAKSHSRLEESDYLFNNPNVQKLSENDRIILSKILAFYDAFRIYNEGLVQREELYRLNIPSESPSPPTQPTPSFPNKPSVRPLRSPLFELPKPVNLSRDSYQEPVGESPNTKETGPRIEGNVVDLKSR